MSISIDSADRILIDNIQTNLAVTQSREKTIVYTPEGRATHYKVHEMPKARYSLAHNNPASGVAGRSEFEHDIKELLKKLS